VVTAVSAPLGLKDRVRHLWSVDGVAVQASAAYEVTGGRTEGYRLWTSLVLPAGRATTRVSVDVQTEGGQLIGRAILPVARE
jgi:hypothetical protein